MRLLNKALLDIVHVQAPRTNFKSLTVEVAGKGAPISHFHCHAEGFIGSTELNW